MESSQDLPLRDLPANDRGQDTEPLCATATWDHPQTSPRSRRLFGKKGQAVLHHEESKDDSASRTPTLSSKSRSWLPTWDLLWTYWKWEIYSCFLAMATIVAAIVTLYPNATSPIPQWPLKISINALLSVYALTFKSAILFVVSSCLGQLQWLWFSFDHPLYDLARYDDAGRGPTGSLRLLWAHHIRQPLAMIGALITVASIAVGPFMQQLLSSSDCSITLDHEQATLPRTSVFDGSGLLGIGRGLETAINQGIYVIPSTGSNFGQCTTGNCTFAAPFRTLGFCSSCIDTSEKIVFESTCSSGGVVTNNTDALGLPQKCPPDSKIHVVSTVPDLSMPLSMESEWAYNSTQDRWDTETTINMCNTSYVWADKGHQSIRVYILAGKTIFSENGWDQITGEAITGCHTPTAKDSWRCRGYGAANCVLQPCVRTYNANITGGILSEQLLEASYPQPWGRGYASRALEEDNDPTFADDYLSLIDLTCTAEEQNSSLEQQGYNIEAAGLWLPYNVSTLDSGPSYRQGAFVKSLLDRECLYMFSINDTFRTRQHH